MKSKSSDVDALTEQLNDDEQPMLEKLKKKIGTRKANQDYTDKKVEFWNAKISCKFET